ncbi:23S rRNA (pseudouridine(1915)-N(3))-methyltransferase RlmH [bacterium]|nr:23S rRNA (pseudouridine(1915)-N(3))-methyltransferase RlmH [candidate division CSSED10-310 bacterium]
MRLVTICVGKLRQKPFRHLADEYIKRISKYCLIEERELRAENVRAEFRARAMAEEGGRILKSLGDGACWAFDRLGEQMDSPGFARELLAMRESGMDRLHLVVGGAFGLDQVVLGIALKTISFSPLTFPHELFRVVLYEQVFRSFKILGREPYHY